MNFLIVFHILKLVFWKYLKDNMMYVNQVIAVEGYKLKFEHSKRGWNIWSVIRLMRLEGKLLKGDSHGREILIKLTQHDSC